MVWQDGNGSRDDGEKAQCGPEQVTEGNGCFHEMAFGWIGKREWTYGGEGAGGGGILQRRKNASGCETGGRQGRDVGGGDRVAVGVGIGVEVGTYSSTVTRYDMSGPKEPRFLISTTTIRSASGGTWKATSERRTPGFSSSLMRDVAPRFTVSSVSTPGARSEVKMR